jgi:BASS family bile acid:Na+ symporter
MGQIAEIFLPLALAFIMFSLGLGLTGADFKRVLVQPKDFLIGALGQVILLPVVALVIVSLWPLEPELSVGVMIIAAAPGGVTSNLLTRFADGDTALSVSLTAVISLLSILTVPAIVFFALDRFGGTEATDLSIASTALSMFAIVAVPVVIGVALRQFASGFAINFEPKGRVLSGILFAIVLAGAIYENRNNVLDYFAQAGLVTLCLNVVMMVLAFLGAMLVGIGRPQRIALSLECGLQNGTLAIAVVTTLGLASAYAIPAAIYSLIMFVTAIFFTVLIARVAPVAKG